MAPNSEGLRSLCTLSVAFMWAPLSWVLLSVVTVAYLRQALVVYWVFFTNLAGTQAIVSTSYL